MNLHSLAYGNNFLDQNTYKENSKFDFIKILGFWVWKDVIKQMQRQPLR